MDTTKREAILARIRALRAKTTENGCTEAEAMAAAEAVARLMDQYQVGEADIESAKAGRYGAGRKQYAKGKHRRVWHPTHNTWMKITALCNCKMYLGHTGEAVVFGEKEDVNTAFYLFDLMQATADREYIAYHRVGNAHGNTVRASWMWGFCQRVNERIADMIRERDQRIAQMEADSNTCREVMVIRGALLKSKWDQYLGEKGIKLRTSRSSVSAGDARAHAAGRTAGGRVSFGGGAGVGGGAKRIGA